MYALLEEFLGLVDESLETADTRTDICTQTLRCDILAADQTAVHHGLIGCCHGILAVDVAAAYIGRIQTVGCGVEVLNLTCDLDGQIILVETLDEIYTAVSCRQIVPEVGYVVADGRDYAQTGDDYSSIIVFHACWFYFVHSIIHAPVVNPAPKALSSSLSPLWSLPSRLSSSSSMATLADEVLP